MINDFSKFYTFMEIVKERSFSKASRALGISQPAVTLQIKKLEEMLQTTLIMRKKNGIVLTREGEKFHKLCLQFEGAMFRFKDEISRIKTDKVPLVIAATQLVAEAVLSMMLDKISQSVGSELDIRIKEQNELIPFLKDRRSDIAIILEQSLDSSLLVKKLFDYELILVSNRKIAENIKLEQLLGFRFIKDRTHTYLDDVLQKHGVDEGKIDVAYSLDGSIMVCRAMTTNNADTYVAFVPRFLIEDKLKEGKLFEINVAKFKLTRSVYAAALKENEEVLRKFLSVKSYFAV
ncbi:transcriptional regulator, LysR family [Campylobacter rectus RM3267]|uniref:Transcriptional regulator, LysR family n=2 Tax=Campylobacter rectus TaxID=203 RepID=A0A6G5QLC6_CAMRE|nr:LysR family transcriptional regulator [Campylobacter rectus]EEF13384.1 transcriptional regulator, LysR family [Campylobacter rectus RM3267]QCD46429.1 transcriptional regulator, LysR family [Campylobacter rectus]UEB47132.1 LysR family transcriptional regulator [Campylobacter rectus]